jgi:hypothetical protein
VSQRPAWVPDDVEDEHVDRYAETLGGQLAKMKWEAHHAGAHSVLAEADQVEAMLRDHTEDLLRAHFDS